MADGTDPAPQGGPPQPAGGPHPLVRLLQEFTLEANRYVDTAGGRKDMHRTDLNALAVIMRHTAKGNVVTPGLLRKELHLSSPATTALIDRLGSGGRASVMQNRITLARFVRRRHGEAASGCHFSPWWTSSTSTSRLPMS